MFYLVIGYLACGIVVAAALPLLTLGDLLFAVLLWPIIGVLIGANEVLELWKRSRRR